MTDPLIRAACGLSCVALFSMPLEAQFVNGNASPRAMASHIFSQRMLFAANDGVGPTKHGFEIWVTQGIAGTTTLVRDIRPGPESSYPEGIVARGFADYVFAADDGTNGTELWISDATAIGTALLKDIQAGPVGSRPQHLTAFGTRVVFVADDGASGDEPWVTDGTSGGTQRLSDVNPGLAGSRIRGFVISNGYAWFGATSALGHELWRTDGTPGGTAMVEDIRTGALGSDPSEIVVLGSGILFAADDGTGSGRELWISDGTTLGTTMVRDIAPGAVSSAPSQLVAGALGRVWFVAWDSVNGRELWATSGTFASTVLVTDIRSGALGSDIREITPDFFDLWFVADDGVNGSEVWHVTGLSGTPTRVTDLVGGAGGTATPHGLTLAQTGRIVFVADPDPLPGRRGIWSCGAPAFVATELTGIRANPPGPQPTALFDSPSLFLPGVWFAAEGDTVGRELYRTDGTIAGTALVADINTESPEQPEMHGHSEMGPAGATIEICIADGQPSAPAALLISANPSLPPPLPLSSVGQLMVFPDFVVPGTLDAQGEFCFTATVSPTSAQFVTQGVYLDTSTATLFFTDRLGVSIESVQTSNIPPWIFKVVGGYNDETHVYGASLELTDVPAGSFGLYRVRTASNLTILTLIDALEYVPSGSGTTDFVTWPEFTDEEGQKGDRLEMRFFEGTTPSDDGGGGTYVWRSYC